MNMGQTLTTSQKCRSPLQISQNSSSWRKTRDRTRSSLCNTVNTRVSNRIPSLPHLRYYISWSFRATCGSRSRRFFPLKQSRAWLPHDHCNSLCHSTRRTSSDQPNEPVLIVFREALRRVHDLVDRANFGTFGVVQPFLLELRCD